MLWSCFEASRSSWGKVDPTDELKSWCPSELFHERFRGRLLTGTSYASLSENTSRRIIRTRNPKSGGSDVSQAFGSKDHIKSVVELAGLDCWKLHCVLSTANGICKTCRSAYILLTCLPSLLPHLLLSTCFCPVTRCNSLRCAIYRFQAIKPEACQGCNTHKHTGWDVNV